MWGRKKTKSGENENEKKQVRISSAMICIYHSEAPEKPTGPIKFSDIMATSLSMEWSASRSDGGSPIQSYKIELTTDKKNWVTVMTCDRYTTKVKVRDLITDQKYHFRVSAVNQVGSSEALMSDEVTPIKPPGRSGLIL